MSIILLCCHPQDCIYLGDETFRATKIYSVRKQEKIRNKAPSSAAGLVCKNTQDISVSLLYSRAATTGRHTYIPRIIMTPQDSNPHIESIHHLHYDNFCQVCGLPTRYKSNLSQKAIGEDLICWLPWWSFLWSYKAWCSLSAKTIGDPLMRLNLEMIFGT